jgi:hypothetical protein
LTKTYVTDNTGRVDLGELPYVTSIRVQVDNASGELHAVEPVVWHVNDAKSEAAFNSRVIIREGETVELPALVTLSTIERDSVMLYQQGQG